MPRTKAKSRPEISFEVSDETNSIVTDISLKLWATNVLCWFNHLKPLQSLSAFSPGCNIKIELFSNDRLISTLKQRRVTKDTILLKDRDFPFPFPKKLYILINYDDNSKISNPNSKQNPTEPTLILEKYLNTIEYLAKDYPKFNSPIIYTGWH